MILISIHKPLVIHDDKRTIKTVFILSPTQVITFIGKHACFVEYSCVEHIIIIISNKRILVDNTVGWAFGENSKIYFSIIIT